MRISLYAVSLMLTGTMVVGGCGGDDGSNGSSTPNGKDSGHMDAGNMDSGMPDGATEADGGGDTDPPRFDELGSCPATVATTIAVGGGGQNQYSPADVTISAGEIVKWQWAGGLHDVTADNNADCSENRADWFQSETKDGTTHTFCVRFNETGEWNYQCTVGDHCEEDMKGVVTVE